MIKFLIVWVLSFLAIATLRNDFIVTIPDVGTIETDHNSCGDVL